MKFKYRNYFRFGSAESILLPDACADLVTGANVLHWANSEEMSKEVDRLLKPGGWFVFYGWAEPQPGIELTDETVAEQLREEYKVLDHIYWCA